VRTRAREEAGFGLIELLMAMTILNIAILALVAAFNAGIISLRRAGQMSTASVLADQQMELYRALTYGSIALDSTALGTVDNTYLCDPALGSSCPNSAASEKTTTCTGLPNECNPSRVTVGPDRHKYRVDTYIVDEQPTASSRTLRRVTVVVRDGLNLSRVLARETSTFDCSTAQPYSNCPTS
jgi:Tfp pilus assembly protein PilV